MTVHGRPAVRVAHIRPDQLDFAEHRVARKGTAVNLVDQTVENANFIATLEQHLDHVAANEAGAARDQNPCRHPGIIS